MPRAVRYAVHYCTVAYGMVRYQVEYRNIPYGVIQAVQLYSAISFLRMAPPEPLKAKIDGGRIERIQLTMREQPCHVSSLLARQTDHAFGKFLEYPHVPYFVRFCQIAAAHRLAQPQMMEFATMGI